MIQSIQNKLDALDERILADSRMVKAVANWSTCMQKAAATRTSPRRTRSTLSLHSKLEAIVGPPESPKPDYDQAALDTSLQGEERRHR